MKEINNLLSKHRLVLSSSEIDLEEAIRIGEKVMNKGVLCGYYIDSGFNHYSAMCSLSRGNFGNSFRVSSVLSYLNPDKPIEVLFEYMDLICKEFFDTETLKVNRSIILNNITKVRDGLYDVSPRVAKYYWVKPYTSIGLCDKEIDGVIYDGKSKVIMSRMNNSRRMQTVSSIENALNVLMESGLEFITSSNLSLISGLSKKTIESVYPMFKSEIDNYNISVFKTEMYGEFVKNCNIMKISSSIKGFISELETKMTKTKISKKTELHINTVYNLWYEEEVQVCLEEYNNWLKEIKKAAQ